MNGILDKIRNYAIMVEIKCSLSYIGHSSTIQTNPKEFVKRNLPLIVVASACLVPQMLKADQITFDSSTPAIYVLGPEGPITAGNLSLEQFNPSLGNLNSVTISLDGEFNSQYILESGLFDDAEGTGTALATLGVQDSEGNLNTSINFSFSRPFSLTIDNDWEEWFDANGAESTQSIFNSAPVLDEFTGFGMISLTGFYQFGIQLSPASSGVQFFPHEPYAQLGGSVTYDYTPIGQISFIPEPSTMCFGAFVTIFTICNLRKLKHQKCRLIQ